MPRKIIYTDQFPYHITARSNNKEWFAVDQPWMWNFFEDALQTVNRSFGFQVHAFILMTNHYHLIGTASPAFPLYKVMQWLQYHITNRVNKSTGRINHVFGERYRASLIADPLYFHHATKYLYRNSVAAGCARKVEEYPYSTLVGSQIPVSCPNSGIATLIPSSREAFLTWLNTAYGNPETEIISKALSKPKFQFPSRLSNETRSKLCHS